MIACGVALAAVLSSGCTSAAQRVDRLAQTAGFRKEIVEGVRFRHVVYRNADLERAASEAAAPGVAPPDRAVLHVYIEGDGSPYRNGKLIAADPTPRDALMLRLMREDSAPSVYLGRPCYYGLSGDAACGPAFWTFRRFSPEVLDSTESVLRAEIARSGAIRVDLFGHSGGATLAVLLAQRVGQVTRVVTIGPVLDIDAWCRLHGYSPLTGSLNPAELPDRRPGLEVLHLVGANDTNTPPALVQAAARARGGEPVQVIARADHNCCWQGTWRDVLLAAP
jgi:hypothetical protein